MLSWSTCVTQHSIAGSYHNLGGTQCCHVQHMYHSTTVLAVIATCVSHNASRFVMSRKTIETRQHMLYKGQCTSQRTMHFSNLWEMCTCSLPCGNVASIDKPNFVRLSWCMSWCMFSESTARQSSSDPHLCDHSVRLTTYKQHGEYDDAIIMQLVLYVVLLCHKHV